MSILTVKNINCGFGDRIIFEDVSFRLLKGDHVGIVGANGEGKSTFMKIITKNLVPDTGQIIWSEKVKVGYMDQHTALTKGLSIREALREAFVYLFEAEKTMNTLYEKTSTASPEEIESILEEAASIQEMLETQDFYIIDTKIETVAQGLGLADIGLEKDVNDLSGGQRTKILLAKLLLEKPDVLLLDEPTNYLDEEHIIWFKDYLINYENAFILISHDIDFLNSTVNLIYNIEEATLSRYVGNYSEFLRLYEEQKKQTLATYEKQKSEISNLKDFIAKNKARAATAGMARSRQKKLDKIDVISLKSEKPIPEFNFKQGRTAEKIIFETKDLIIGYTEPLSTPINLTLERGQKITLIGSNGLGKTTLLKSLLEEIPSMSGQVISGANRQIGYFEQEVKDNNNKTCIDEVWDEFPGYSQYEVRRALAKCGLTTQQLESKVFTLSGGEQAKVRLCKIINNESNVLILDEPTNHLDPMAKEELKRALIAYKGTILMVCHEPEFYKEYYPRKFGIAQNLQQKLYRY